jgi:hypothetical protein
LFIGTTYTQAAARDAEGFLQSMKDRRTRAAGRHNDFYALAFSIYKIAYDFMSHRGITPSTRTSISFAPSFEGCRDDFRS